MVNTPLIAQIYAPLAGMPPIRRPELQAQPLAHKSIVELRSDRQYTPQELPDRAGTCGDLGAWRVLRLRPDGWLMTADTLAPAEMPIATHQQEQLRRTDVSHGYACIRLAGASMRRLLAFGTPLDLRPDRFGPGQCARTWCAGFTLILDHRADSIDVYVETPCATALWGWLIDAAAGLLP